MNKAIMIGRLTKDPEVRYTQSNTAVASFTLAVDRRLTKEQKDKGYQSADFIPCVAWSKLAETAGKYLHKGSKVAIEGRIQTRSYDAQDGSKRYVTEVLLSNLEFLDSKKDSQQGEGTISEEEIPF